MPLVVRLVTVLVVTTPVSLVLVVVAGDPVTVATVSVGAVQLELLETFVLLCVTHPLTLPDE